MLVKLRGWSRFLAIPLIAITLASGLLFAPPAKADTYTPNPGESCKSGETTITANDGTTTCQTASNGAAGARTNAKSCAVEKVGWFVCPIMEAGAKAIDWTFNMLADRFLAIQPEIFNNTSPTKDIWEQARNIANVMFVIAFVILVYSQITGGVMSNYGIKRMLPRLIIGAVAVNLSYYICQALVDLSNIMGYTIYDAFKDVTSTLPQVLGEESGKTINTQTSSGLSGLIVLILGAAAVVWAFVGFGSAIISVTLITLLTVMTILMLRKAFIILLIVLSPLAFVAYLLPNTEKYFKKWWSTFAQLLLIFPIVALMLSAGTLASGIVLRAGLSQSQSTACQAGEKVDPDTGNVCSEGTFQPKINGTAVNGQAPWTLGLIAVGIQIAPLLFIWTFLKAAISTLGAIGSAVRSATEKGAGGAVGLGRDKWKNSDFVKNRERNEHHMDAQVRAGTFQPKWYRPIRSSKSALNKQIVTHGDKIGLGSLGAYKNLTAQALDAEEAKKTSALLQGDGDFAAVAALTGDGTEDEFKENAMKEYGLSEDAYKQEWENSGRLDRFRKLKQGGYLHSAGTYAAMAELGASSGKASGRAIVAAAEHAYHASNDRSVQSQILQSAKSTTKKTGRSDTYAHVIGAIGGDYAYNHGHEQWKSEDAQQKAYANAFAVADGISKDMFKGPQGNANLDYFNNRLLDPENGKARFEGNLRAYTSFNSETQGIIDPGMLAAANHWREAGTPEFKTIQDARNYYLKNH